MTKQRAEEPDDPYLWLEDIHSEAALAWAAERTVETETAFASAERSALQNRLRGILDDPDRLIVPSRHGEWMYHLWRDAANPRGLWRRTSRASFRSGDPDWQILVDLDQLGRSEHTTWSFAGAVHAPGGVPRVLLRLSPDGGDAVVVREFDLERPGFVEDADAFRLDAHKTIIAWIDFDTVLVATAQDGGGTTESGYPDSARLWRRGTPLAEASVMVQASASDVGVFPRVDHSEGRATACVEVAHDFFRGERWVWDACIPGSKAALIHAPQDAHVDVHGDRVLVRTTTEWEVAGILHPGGMLLAGELAALLDDSREPALEVVFAPTTTAVLEGWTWTHTRVMLTVLQNVQSRILACDPAAGWSAAPITLGGESEDLLTISVTATDADEDDELWLVASGFLTPPTLTVTDAVNPTPRIVDRARAVFDTTGLVAAQHWATSADGTRIPYFEVGPRERDGAASVLMSGYGGFEHALTPEYPSIIGPAWLERGDVFVVAGIRGGGEFGPAWHRAALRENRHRAYEDFAAVARDLVRRGVSTADRIGCHGRSNGGLLVGNMLTSYPEDFGAIVCGVPLLDMRRYTRLSAGASWIAEYGDPDDPDDWEFVRTFSPYHLIDRHRPYPPALLYAATSDDRVGPVQARKMAARLLADTSGEVHYLEPVEGGHAGTIDNAATAALHATIYAFLIDVLERRPQQHDRRAA